MKVLLIGATGVIGKEVKKLFEKDHEVIPVSNKSSEYTIDLASKDSIKNLLEKVGKIDAIVSTAGNAEFGSINDLTDEQINISLENKLMGQVNLVRLGKDFVNEGGTITLTSGVLATDPMPGSTIISLVNAGLEAFVKATALEINNLNINIVSPVFVKETMEMMRMDSTNGMPSENLAYYYKLALERNLHGKKIDVKQSLDSF